MDVDLKCAQAQITLKMAIKNKNITCLDLKLFCPFRKKKKRKIHRRTNS